MLTTQFVGIAGNALKLKFTESENINRETDIDQTNL